MNYNGKKCLVVAGLIAIGSDGAVSENELQLMDRFLRKNGVTAKEEEKILKEITPRLGSAVSKGNLFREVSKTITTEEKKEVLRFCAGLILSDMALGKVEAETLKKIGIIMGIPARTIQAIIDSEMAGKK